MIYFLNCPTQNDRVVWLFCNVKIALWIYNKWFSLSYALRSFMFIWDMMRWESYFIRYLLHQTMLRLVQAKPIWSHLSLECNKHSLKTSNVEFKSNLQLTFYILARQNSHSAEFWIFFAATISFKYIAKYPLE